MATNITGVTGNAAGANAANRTDRATHLATQIGQMEPQQARNILSTLNGKIGNRWGYLRLDGSGKGQEVGFTTRWNTNPFRSARGQVTGAALRALFEKAGYDTAALDTYLRDRGNARIELAQVRGFLTNQGPVAPAVENQPLDLKELADSLTQQCVGTLGRSVDLGVAKLREASDAIRHQPVSERHRFYTGEDKSLQRADQVLYLLQDSELSNWDDTTLQIFKTLQTMVDSSRTNNDFKGVVQRFDAFKNDFGKHLQAHQLKADIRDTAELFSAAEPADLETAKHLLSLLHQSTQGDLKPYLRRAPLLSHADVAMRAIDAVLAQPGSDEIQGMAKNLKSMLINNFTDTVLENAQARFVDGFPEIRIAEVEWMRMALENLRSPSDHDGIEVLFSNYAEGVNLLLYAATELAKQQPLAPEFTDSLKSIRQSYEKEPGVNAAIAACKTIFYLDAYDGYVFPLGNGQVLTCDADGFAAWVTGKNPNKQLVVVYDLVNGEASINQNRLELNRMLGLAEVPLFAKGLATLDSSVARNVVDRLLAPESNQAATRDLFHLALKGQKEALSVSQLNEEISPIFTRIWGEQVVAADTTQWDNVRLAPQHFADLRGLMPAELGQDDGGYARFLINLSSIFTKLGSASVWGDENTSVADLRLYGYLLFREAQEKSPNLLPENNWSVLIENYKDPTFCAQILSFRQMDQAKTADDLAYRLVVPPALR
jgi:hypothetical protein